jgi:hypothetical protein
VKKEQFQISVRGETYKRLVDGLSRNRGGRIRPGALKDRVEQLINEALDREEGA